VIHDAQTGKKSLIGVFHELRASRFPALHPAMWVYANLTDAHGRYAFQIRLLDVSRNKVLGTGAPPPLEIPGPLQTTEIAAQMRNIALPEAGTYEFQLMSNNGLVATKAIRVTKLDAKQKPPGS
jgi:hypothetical protein